jgi:S1-C subfamily serine protease
LGLFRVDPYYEYPYRVINLPLSLIFGPIEFRDRTGSGFFIARDVVVTNAHVIENASTITCELVDGRSSPATIVSEDDERDLALLRLTELPGQSPRALEPRRTPVRPGEACLAIGFPGRDVLTGSAGIPRNKSDDRPCPTVTLGIVSAEGVDLGNPSTRYIETDAALNPGSSGGPLLDLEGRVVGVATMVGAGKQGEGYAVPVGEVLGSFESAVPGGTTPSAKGP